MMRKSILLLFCMIFGFAHAQYSKELINKYQIDEEISIARKLSSTDLKKTIEISEKIYTNSKIIGYKKGMLESSTFLMAKYFDMGNFKKVVELSKEAERLAIETEDNEMLSNTYRLRGSSYTELGLNDQSMKEFRKALNITSKIETNNYRHYQQALIYMGFGSYFAHINAPIDSVIHYQKKSLETTLKIDTSKDYINKKHHLLALNYINLGMTSNASKRVEDALRYFSKALTLCQNGEYIINKDLEVKVLNEFAWLYFDQNNYIKATYFAEQAEQMEKKMSLPYIRRDIYEVLFKSQVEIGKKTTSSKYMNLYIALNDSLVNAEKKTLDTPIKHMKDEQGDVNTNNIQKILITSFVILIMLILAGLFFGKRNQKVLHKKYELIIESLKREEKESIKPVNNEDTNVDLLEKNFSISDDTTAIILKKLLKFEESQKFIRKDLNLTYLANSFNTNTRSLSEIIKTHKGKNFNNYVNGLRIHYITEILYKIPQYREYKISYLAEVCGFSSREVFAVVFKKETGVTPSYFISKLRNEETKS